MAFFKRRYNGVTASKSYPGPGTFAHGVHPPQRKELAADAPIEIIPPPEKVRLPLQQHIGGPCTPIVQPKQHVAFGELIGKGEAFVSASLHAPLAGIVQKMEVTTLANGRHMQAIVIRGEGEQLCGQALWDELFGGKWPQKSYQAMDPAKITAGDKRLRYRRVGRCRISHPCEDYAQR